MKTETPKRGGKREGSGRKPQGKKHYDVTLTEAVVTDVRKVHSNLSGLIDGLLEQWLGQQR